jgi:hypothetical protein
MALSVPSVSIVEKFRCALEACDRAHAQVSDATPCAQFPLQRGALLTSAAATLPLAAALPPVATALPPAAAALSSSGAALVSLGSAPTAAPFLGPVAAQTLEPAPRPSALRLVGYGLLLCAAAALALYLRARFLVPLLQSWRVKWTGDEEPEESAPRRGQRDARRRTGRQDEGSGRAAMAAHLRARSEAVEKDAPAQAKAVDLRRIRFHEAPAPEAPAVFFESTEPDPNFVPI